MAPGAIIFYPVYLTLFTVISMETRNMNSVFIQILMTRFFDLVTGNSFKRCLQQDSLLRSQVVETTTQTQASRTKTARPIRRRKSRVAGGRRVKNMQCREKSAKRELSDKMFSTINVETFCRIYVDQRSFVKTCWSDSTTAKVWNFPNFCQFFAREKLEVNKIGSGATR